MPCSNCGSSQVESEPASGASICTNCGTVRRFYFLPPPKLSSRRFQVLEENTIVSEVTFAENAAGGSVLQGQFVSATTGSAPLRTLNFLLLLNPPLGTKPMPMGPGVGGFSRESREVTLQNGARLSGGRFL